MTDFREITPWLKDISADLKTLIARNPMTDPMKNQQHDQVHEGATANGQTQATTLSRDAVRVVDAFAQRLGVMCEGKGTGWGIYADYLRAFLHAVNLAQRGVLSSPEPTDAIREAFANGMIEGHRFARHNVGPLPGSAIFDAGAEHMRALAAVGGGQA
jgi:hypothetical protein